MEMATSIEDPVVNDVMVSVADLRFDLQNPRIPTELFKT